MDESTLGLAPLAIEELANIIRDINASGITILLVEQNAGLVTRVSHSGYILEVGKVVLQGNISELMSNKLVQKAFLGG